MAGDMLRGEWPPVHSGERQAAILPTSSRSKAICKLDLPTSPKDTGRALIQPQRSPRTGRLGLADIEAVVAFCERLGDRRRSALEVDGTPGQSAQLSLTHAERKSVDEERFQAMARHGRHKSLSFLLDGRQGIVKAGQQGARGVDALSALSAGDFKHSGRCSNLAMRHDSEWLSKPS